MTDLARRSAASLAAARARTLLAPALFRLRQGAGRWTEAARLLLAAPRRTGLLGAPGAATAPVAVRRRVRAPRVPRPEQIGAPAGSAWRAIAAAAASRFPVARTFVAGRVGLPAASAIANMPLPASTLRISAGVCVAPGSIGGPRLRSAASPLIPLSVVRPPVAESRRHGKPGVRAPAGAPLIRRMPRLATPSSGFSRSAPTAPLAAAMPRAAVAPVENHAPPLPPPLRVQPAPPAPWDSAAPLDGAQIGRWVTDQLTEAASRPPSGLSGLDDRLTPVFAGMVGYG